MGLRPLYSNEIFDETGSLRELYERLVGVLREPGEDEVPGDLTRVAQPGTRVANSTAGGGTKDTWVLEDGPRP